MLGVIGGMGPLATSLFYDMIIDKTGAKRDQDNLNMIILNHADMPDRTGAILSGETEEVRRKMLKDAMILELQGCDAIAVTCNTAHYFVDMIEKDVNIPFIHMIRETARELRKDFSGKPVAILATDGTIRTGLYQKEFEKNGILPYVPSEECQKKVMYTIYERIKMGKPADAAAFGEIGKELYEQGCAAAILACTELSVVKKQLALDSFYRDPMEIMADRCIDFFREKGEIR